MIRKKQSPRLAHNSEPWKYSNLSPVKFWQRRQQGVFARIKDLYAFGKEKLEDIKKGCGFCKISMVDLGFLVLGFTLVIIIVN